MKVMLDIAKPIVIRFEPDEFEDQYEAVMVDLSAVPTTALRRSVEQEAAAAKAPGLRRRRGKSRRPGSEVGDSCRASGCAL